MTASTPIRSTIVRLPSGRRYVRRSDGIAVLIASATQQADKQAPLREEVVT